MKLRFAWIIVGAGIVGGTSTAQADHHRYVGHHPISAKPGDGFCYIEFPHVHTYAPAKAKVLYRPSAEGYYFVGDPIAFGYDGDKHQYHGAHPIQVDNVVLGVETHEPQVEWCYLKGPHFHSHPAGEAGFEVKGDVYWYVGKYPPEFRANQKAYAQINAVYRPIVYTRPVIEVAPPEGYVDVFVVDVHAAPVVSTGAHLDIHVPVPTLEVSVGAVPVHHHHRHYKHKKYKKHRKYKSRKRVYRRWRD
jgi:hypothetical protein